MFPANITGAVIINNSELASGIPLDKYTVLTAAHMLHPNSEKIIFKLAESAYGDEEEKEYQVVKVILHDSFKFNEKSFVEIGAIALEGIPYSKIKTMTFEEFQNSVFWKKIHYSGVDLAILKLSKPLPENLTYPTILNSNEIPEDSFMSVSVGFGPPKTNNQVKGPQLFDFNYEDQLKRHAIRCNVWKDLTDGNKIVLHGKYEGLLINGDESFIPQPKMSDLEGLPVGGDSGGPLFIIRKGKYKLAGILSANLCPSQMLIEDENIKNLSAFK